MSIDTWHKNQLKKLAFASGKPLEVQCAAQFFQRGWHVRLGSFYRDISSDELRELDALVEKSQQVDLNNQKCKVTLRVLCSCKGFPTDNRPVTYSVSQSRNVVLKPKFLFEGRTRFGPIMTAMGEQGADDFIRREGLEDRQVIGFDIFERAVTQKKNVEVIVYKRKADRDLYQGLDSAIKAAMFWFEHDTGNYQQYNVAYATLSVPLLVTSFPFFDFIMDKGQPTDREIRHSGYFVGHYPFSKDPENIMTVICDVAKLGDLITHFDFLFDFLCEEIKLVRLNA